MTSSSSVPHILRHERLVAYQTSVAVARWLSGARFPRGDADLRNQALRAARSCCLNIAEGTARTGKDRLYHFRVAMGSASEACAVLDVVDLPDGDAQQAKLRLAVAMISKLR